MSAASSGLVACQPAAAAKGAGMHELRGEPLAPEAVPVGPAAHHAARGNDQRHPVAFGGLVRVAQRQQPEGVVMNDVPPAGAQMRAQGRRPGQPARRDAGETADGRRLARAGGDGLAGLECGQELDGFAERRLGVGEGAHRFRGTAVAFPRGWARCGRRASGGPAPDGLPAVLDRPARAADADLAGGQILHHDRTRADDTEFSDGDPGPTNTSAPSHALRPITIGAVTSGMSQRVKSWVPAQR